LIVYCKKPPNVLAYPAAHKPQAKIEKDSLPSSIVSLGSLNLSLGVFNLILYQYNCLFLCWYIEEYHTFDAQMNKINMGCVTLWPLPFTLKCILGQKEEL